MSHLIMHSRTQQAVDELLANPRHAVIITGQMGVGKESIGRQIMADLLNTSLEKLANHPYVKILGESNEPIKIEHVRELQHFLSRKAAQTGGINRVALIISADRMTQEAQNALLKTLEEPPVDSMIIMTAKDGQALLATVRSRSQMLHVTAPDKGTLRDYFAQQGHDRSAIDKVMFMSGGLPGLMTALLEQDTNHPLVKAAETARNILRLDTFGRLALVDILSKQKELCRDTLFILQQMAELSLADASKNIAAQKQWRAILERSFAAEQTLADTNATAKLVLTDLMLTL